MRFDAMAHKISATRKCPFLATPTHHLLQKSCGSSTLRVQ